MQASYAILVKMLGCACLVFWCFDVYEISNSIQETTTYSVTHRSIMNTDLSFMGEKPEATTAVFPTIFTHHSLRCCVDLLLYFSL